VSFLLKIPFFLVGAAGLMVLITSGNYQNVPWRWLLVGCWLVNGMI
jgi:hypothetical protein